MALPSMRQLEYFVTAAEAGTLAAAAAEHHIAQPSVSEQISSLERQLRVKLFTRTSRRLLLTDAGKQLLPLAQRTLSTAREFAEWGRGISEIEHGTVSFGTYNSAHLYVLNDVVREFTAMHPGVRIQVTGLNSADVAEAVRSGHLEAGLLQLPTDDRELNVIPSAFRDPVVYASIHSDRTAKPVDIHTLVTRPLILAESRYSLQDPLRVTLRERAQREGITLEPIVEVEFQTHAMELASQGVGDCLVSYHAGRQAFADKGLHWTPIVPRIEEHHAFVTRKNGRISPATAKFMELTGKVLDDLAEQQAGDPALQSEQWLSTE